MNHAVFAFAPVLAENSIAYAFGHSDFVGQGICFVLFLFSIFTWVVMIEKGSALGRAERENARFLNAFRERHNPLAIQPGMFGNFAPIASIFYTVCEKIEAFHLADVPGGPRRALNDKELGIVHAALEQAAEEQLVILDKRMIFLATAISACPFLGLFGTVWGITIAFTELAQQGKADIQTLAPGVSGALLTTVIALIVAIPSLVGYNIITSKIKKMTVKLDNFSEEFESRLKIEQMDSLQQIGK